jgi:hypothetical protein
LGNLTTPKRVQKLQMALPAKAKAEAGYRFYALYDKISREDILAHAYAQCRSNKGAPGVDGQDFADIELALAHIAIPERRAAEHADLPLSGAMSLAATRTAVGGVLRDQRGGGAGRSMGVRALYH